MRVVLVTLMMVKKVATLMKKWKGSLIGLRPNAPKVHDVQCTLQFAQCCATYNAHCTMHNAKKGK